MAQACQAVGAGQARRPGAHHGDGAPRQRRACEQRLAGLGEIGVGGVTLQESDFDRFVFQGVAHTGLLTQHFGRADTGAHAAQGVGRQNAVRGAPNVVIGNSADERGNVNPRWARGDAGRIKAVVTTVCFELGLGEVQRGVRVAKILCILIGA